MTNVKLDKIKAMMNAGFTDEQIETNLNVTKADIYEAIMGEQPAEKKEEKKERAKSDAVIRHLNEARMAALESKRKKSRETYEKYKGLLEDWPLSYNKFAKKYGISSSTAWRIAHSATAEDYINNNAEANAKKKFSEKPSKKNWEKSKTNAKTEIKPKEVNAKEYVDPKLVEFRSMSDSLARIAEAFEKIAAEQPKKRGLFRK